MPRLFLSYRRNDTEGRYLAHMIFRELRGRYGQSSVFLDVDSRSPGLSFPRKVAAALDNSDAMLVVIGSEWLSELHRRKDDPRDWVRYEVAEALKREKLPVVPICSAGTTLPTATALPPDLQDLAWRDGVTLDPFVDFDSHLARLLEDLDRVVREVAAHVDPLASPQEAPARDSAAIAAASPTPASGQDATSANPLQLRGSLESPHLKAAGLSQPLSQTTAATQPDSPPLGGTTSTGIESPESVASLLRKGFSVVTEGTRIKVSKGGVNRYFASHQDLARFASKAGKRGDA